MTLVRHGRFSHYSLPMTPTDRRDTRCCQNRHHPAFRSSLVGLRRRASVDRQSVSCFHTQPVCDTHSSLFAPTSTSFRDACLCCSRSRDFRRLPFIKAFFSISPPFLEISFSVREPSLPVVIGAKFGIRAYKPRLYGVSARFY